MKRRNVLLFFIVVYGSLFLIQYSSDLHSDSQKSFTDDFGENDSIFSVVKHLSNVSNNAKDITEYLNTDWVCKSELLDRIVKPAGQRLQTVSNIKADNIHTPFVYDLIYAYPKPERESVKLRKNDRLNKWKERSQQPTSKFLNEPIFTNPDVPISYQVSPIVISPNSKIKIGRFFDILLVSKNIHQLTIECDFGVLQIEDETCNFTVNENSLEIHAEIPKIKSCTQHLYYEHKYYHPKGANEAIRVQLDNYDPVYLQITIKYPELPFLYDFKTHQSVETMTTIVAKTFIRNFCLKQFLSSIRKYYPEIKIMIADDSPDNYAKSNKRTCERFNADYYQLPEKAGWNAGRNLLVSQVSSEYVVWMDDDFLVTKHTDLNLMFKFLEHNPYYDLVAGNIDNSKKESSWAQFAELDFIGDDMCLVQRSTNRNKYPDADILDPENHKFICRSADLAINFWMARTNTIRKIGFDNEMKRFAHKEFFVDGRGKMAVAQCTKPTVSHNYECGDQELDSGYFNFRNPNNPKSHTDFFQRWYFRSSVEYLLETSSLKIPVE